MSKGVEGASRGGLKRVTLKVDTGFWYLEELEPVR
jgi:hypothetical protein